VRSWKPTAPARGVVMNVPGFNSHSACYSWVAEQLSASALAVYALDLRDAASPTASASMSMRSMTMST